MSQREWLAVYGSLLTKAKYRRLTPSARGALLHCWALSTTQTPEASWPNRDALVDLLELDGFAVGDYDQLITGRWLESDDDGRIWIHDWDDHQLAATADAGRKWEAARKRQWRRKKATAPTPPPVPPTPTEQNKTLPNKGPGHVSDMSRTPSDGKALSQKGWEEFGPKWAPFRTSWTRYGFVLPPSSKQREKLWSVVDAFPMKVTTWIEAAPRNLDSFALVRYIFDRHSAETGNVPLDEPAEREPDDGTAAVRLSQILAH